MTTHVKQITVTNEVQNKSFSGVSFHVKHEKYDRKGNEINHSNKDIDFSRTQFNKTIANEKIHLLNETEFFKYEKNILTNLISDKKDENKISDFKPIEQRLIKETINYNLKRIGAGHREEVKKSVAEYVKDRKGVFQKRGIITLGNKDDWLAYLSNYEKMSKKSSPESVNNFFNGLNKVFKDYTETFNKTFGENMKITKAVTNLDEATPHLHYELTMMSIKNGKTSFSLNENVKQARERLTGKPAPKDSRANLKWFREKTDNMMIDSWNRFSKMQFQLKRTGQHTAKDQKIYEEIQEQKKRANCEIIRDYEPEAKITYGKDKQGNKIESEPIKTETGFNAFLNQPLDWLKKVKERYKERFQKKLAQFKKEIAEFEREKAQLDQDRSQFIDFSSKSLSDSLSVDEYRKKIENNQKANSNQKESRRVQSRRLKITPVSNNHKRNLRGMSR